MIKMIPILKSFLKEQEEEEDFNVVAPKEWNQPGPDEILVHISEANETEGYVASEDLLGNIQDELYDLENNDEITEEEKNEINLLNKKIPYDYFTEGWVSSEWEGTMDKMNSYWYNLFLTCYNKSVDPHIEDDYNDYDLSDEEERYDELLEKLSYEIRDLAWDLDPNNEVLELDSISLIDINQFKTQLARDYVNKINQQLTLFNTDPKIQKKYYKHEGGGGNDGIRVFIKFFNQTFEL